MIFDTLFLEYNFLSKRNRLGYLSTHKRVDTKFLIIRTQMNQVMYLINGSLIAKVTVDKCKDRK